MHINDIIIPFNYPIPFRLDLIRISTNKQKKSKSDCKSRFRQIKVKEEDMYKMTFSVQQGLFKWNDMPFGFCMTSPYY